MSGGLDRSTILGLLAEAGPRPKSFTIGFGVESFDEVPYANSQAEAQEEEQRLNVSKVQYEQRLTIRDQQRDSVDSIKEHIQKLKAIADDPETPKVIWMGNAPVPLEVSSPKWS